VKAKTIKKIPMDLLLVNGAIYTMKSEGERVETLGIKAGIIIYTGDKDSLDLSEVKEIIDLKGKTVLPGLGDSHLHLYAYCQSLTSVGLEEARSIDDLIATMKKEIMNTSPGQWVKGVGFDQTKFRENRMPTRQDLDKISQEHPMVVRRCCLHMLTANSLAIEMAKITPKQFEDFGDLIEKDENGNLSGVFRERSTIIFDDIVPDTLKDPKTKRAIFNSVLKDMSAKGMTCIHTYAAQIWNYEEDINNYLELDQENLLPLRVTVNLDEFWVPQDKKANKEDPFNKVQLGAYKIFTDGSLGARSAALFEDYSDEPGTRGIIGPSQDLREKMEEAVGRGLQCAIHAIGDRAMEETLDAIDWVLERGEPSNPLPFRIIHAQMVTDSQRERMKNMPLILDIQPVFLCTDLYWIKDRLGPERMKYSYIWKTLIDQGFLMTGGSDCPVETYDPLKGIHAAVNRQDIDGNPAGGFMAREKLSVYQAFSLFTKNIHYATGDQNNLGTLETGKFGDFVVFRQDPFAIDPRDILKLEVDMTYLAGKKVFEKD
jgi:predicted amidohydrolase YtcJ